MYSSWNALGLIDIVPDRQDTTVWHGNVLSELGSLGEREKKAELTNCVNVIVNYDRHKQSTGASYLRLSSGDCLESFVFRLIKNFFDLIMAVLFVF